MSYYQGEEPSHKFVEFVVVKRPGILSLFPEAIILFESSTRGINNYELISHRLKSFQ